VTIISYRNKKNSGSQVRIAILPGDGIGPDIVAETTKVLNAVGERFSRVFTFEEALIGGAAIDETGNPLPSETLELCQSSQAVLLGAIGGPKWDTTDPEGIRPEQGLLGIRKALNLFANLRPVRVLNVLIGSSTLKREVVEGVDILVVRELTSGLYFGARARENDRAYDTCDYHRYEIERIIHKAFQLARQRKKRVHSVDKANVLESSRLWREVATEIGKKYPDVELCHQLVDNTAMQIIKYPRQFDVLVTENMFGDILSDEASMLSGSLGMLPSASLGEGRLALYEPAHGSAPKYAGQNVANPIATILSGALMLRYSFGWDEEAQTVERAVERTLEQGYRTKDIKEEGTALVGTSEMGDLIARNVSKV
jgi:3-isopropylmalate dehydrogenase